MIDADQKAAAASPSTKESKPDPTQEAQAEAAVKRWTTRIRNAKKHWEPAFKRMRQDMDFASGLQWPGQETMETKRYVANTVLRTINQKVATLYARNPVAEYQRRPRMDYQVWDERLESLLQATQSLAMNPLDIQSKAILTDYMNGHNRKMLIDKVGRTLEIVYKYQQDEQEPNFKTQMKRLVRRVATCGVGYTRLSYVRDNEAMLSPSGKQSSLQDRIKKTRRLAEKYEEGDVNKESATAYQLGHLFASVGHSMTDPVELQDVHEGLVFDFPSATAIIPDTRCRSIRDFDGCHWIAEEMLLPLEIVNAFFESDIKPGGELIHYSEHGQYKPKETNPDDKDPEQGPHVCLWHVFDQDTKSQFYIVDGYKKFVSSPDVLAPPIRRFWPIFTLTFNDVESDPQSKTSVFPPSDVTLMRSMQKERNRSRDQLKQHRVGSLPLRMTGKGWLTKEDKDSINGAEANEIIEIEGAGSASQGLDLNKMLAAFQPAPINPAVYDTAPLDQDVLLVVGGQQEALPVAKKESATSATIAEQSRNLTSSSNVDDLDELLSDLARSGGEMLMREMATETVQRIAGPGSAWPTVEREDFLDEIYLEAVAASSGRPNKAVEIANFERLVPFLMQAGASPAFIVREGIHRLDDRLDPEEAFPLLPPQMSAPPPQPKGGTPNGQPNQPTPPRPQQPPQQLPSQAPVPLAAA